MTAYPPDFYLWSSSYMTNANLRLSGCQELTLMEPWPPKTSGSIRSSLPSRFMRQHCISPERVLMNQLRFPSGK